MPCHLCGLPFEHCYHRFTTYHRNEETDPHWYRSALDGMTTEELEALSAPPYKWQLDILLSAQQERYQANDDAAEAEEEAFNRLHDVQMFDKEVFPEEVQGIFEKGPLRRVSAWERLVKDDET